MTDSSFSAQPLTEEQQAAFGDIRDSLVGALDRQPNVSPLATIAILGQLSGVIIAQHPAPFRSELRETLIVNADKTVEELLQ